ncbi:LON peptidase substrate-binding domain-containing protein [Paludisphaera sp.]|uniref:LON peptidase substrate-binding domain-containing protein n=1 Tax=Paludisphaera sp. TaxID=2017432 RepID=UPI00301DFCB9
MDDMDLKGASGRVRLFPLPGVVMFPHVVAPLHIFEPRYRRMTEDALAGDRLIAMVRLLGDESPRPSIEVVGCLGRIIRHERLPDGRFNLLLLGRRRVRLLGEVDEPELPYRVAEAVAMEDEIRGPLDEAAARKALIGRFREAIAAAAGLDDEFFRLLEAAESLGALADVMAHSLPLDADRKQRLLAEPDVQARIFLLDGWLAELTPSLPQARSFPPPFSAN